MKARIWSTNNISWVQTPRGEGYWFDLTTGQIGVESENDDGEVVWFSITRYGFHQQGRSLPTREMYELLDLVAYGIGGKPTTN